MQIHPKEIFMIHIQHSVIVNWHIPQKHQSDRIVYIVYGVDLVGVLWNYNVRIMTEISSCFCLST